MIVTLILLTVLFGLYAGGLIGLAVGDPRRFSWAKRLVGSDARSRLITEHTPTEAEEALSDVELFWVRLLETLCHR